MPSPAPVSKMNTRERLLYALGWVEVQTHDMGTVVINPKNVEMFSGGGGRPQITMRSGKTFQPTPVPENQLDALLERFKIAVQSHDGKR